MLKHCGRVLLGVVGAAVVITLIAVPTAIYLNDTGGVLRETFTLEDYFNNTIRYRSYNLLWISDYEYLHKPIAGSVFLHNVETRNSSLFLNISTFLQVDATDYILSADRKYVCFESNYTKKWRHSFTATYSIYDVENMGFVTPSHIPPKVQYLAWAPTGNKLAFVWNYNVYLKPNATAEAIQVTTNGEENKILNGVPDWPYEEEMFASNYAMWWSPGGMYLAYIEFNDTLVHTIDYSWYGEGQYPKTVAIPYPKAGSTNPVAKLYVVDTANTSRITQVLVPASVGAGDHYLSSVTWVTDERIAVQWERRRQNSVVLQIYDFVGNHWNETASHEETSKTGWVGHYSPLHPFFTADNISFYKVMSDSDGYKHIHYVNSGVATAITSGEWEVIYISKLTTDAIYYVSNEHQSPGKRNVYKVGISHGGGHSAPLCLSCDLREDRCQYNSAYFSADASYYRMDCYGPGLPLYTLRDNGGAGSEISVLQDNQELELILNGFHLPSTRRGTIKVGQFDLWYQMTLPPEFDESKKYPLLIDVYAGPCSQRVDFRFRLSWATYLSSTEKIIVASFDGRGSGYQGDKIMHAIYQRLGTYEVEDQILAVRKFIDMGFVDKERIAIWGWSYGGYVTSMALGAGTGLFKCGIAVAPVAKWEYYDSFYTERYMNRPTDNAEFYANSTVASRAKNFKSVDYLLIHGTADDNVHFQQAAQIAKALVEKEVDFEAMWYTDKDHGLRGSAFHHVFIHMSHFLKKCLIKAK
ncbi:hypothetical protein SKAU_G00258370 [Synaphobranchus kaupii]|uniref:Uncharacterized protein n=1 Tax=Synaphobranchus kaupii TaxID=118154 RepID=A0A9Q1ISM0_SYNKA|nr:hypothetical protein SKAU_G00258370 [Synaphobranchus kaupii]